MGRFGMTRVVVYVVGDCGLTINAFDKVVILQDLVTC